MNREIQVYTRGRNENEWSFLSYGWLTDMYDVHSKAPLPRGVASNLSRSLWAHQNQTWVEMVMGGTEYRVEVGRLIEKEDLPESD